MKASILSQPLHTLPPKKKTEWLRQWCISEHDFIAAALETCGVPRESLVGGFPCVVPTHGQHRSSITYDKHDAAVYCCHDEALSEKRVFLLSELYASTRFGRAVEFTKRGKAPDAVQIAVWMLLLLVNTGFLTAVTLPAKVLPTDASESLRAVYEAFLKLVGARWLHTPGMAVPFTTEYAAGISGLKLLACKAALHGLRKQGYLNVVRGSGRVKEPNLYLPVGQDGKVLDAESGTMPALTTPPPVVGPGSAFANEEEVAKLVRLAGSKNFTLEDLGIYDHNKVAASRTSELIAALAS
jgi:hypothetical protein